MSEKKWTVISRRPVVKHPQLQVTMEEVSLPDGNIIADWPIINVRNYSNAVVTSKSGDILVQEGYRHGARRSSWQMLERHLENGQSDPFGAIEQRLSEIGYISYDWEYLGSFVVDGNQHVSIAHFFLALAVEPALEEEALQRHLAAGSLRWVSRQEVQRALLDGRINVINNATNLLLAFMVQERRECQKKIDRLQQEKPR